MEQRVHRPCGCDIHGARAVSQSRNCALLTRVVLCCFESCCVVVCCCARVMLLLSGRFAASWAGWLSDLFLLCCSAGCCWSPVPLPFSRPASLLSRTSSTYTPHTHSTHTQHSSTATNTTSAANQLTSTQHIDTSAQTPSSLVVQLAHISLSPPLFRWPLPLSCQPPVDSQLVSLAHRPLSVAMTKFKDQHPFGQQLRLKHPTVTRSLRRFIFSSS